MRLSFHGAASGVTGSCYLLEVEGYRILVDCGMFQGKDELFSSNLKPFSFDPASISAVLLTHAHLDHCGRLPFLVRQGFRGPIYATAPTRYLTEIVLWDAAHLQEEHFQGSQRHTKESGRSGGRTARIKHASPFYSLADVMDTMTLFSRPPDENIPVGLFPGIDVTFYPAGHILGSASIQIVVSGRNRKTRILFSGDLGPSRPALLNPPSPPEDSDYVVMETTYGDRLHRSLADSKDELLDVLEETHRRGGQVLVPTFALERTQDLLFFFREWKTQGQLPGHQPFFLDSPMAINVTHIYEKFPDLLNERLLGQFKVGQDPFVFPDLKFVRTASESRDILRSKSSAVILAGSGMISGGRILYHLAREMDHPRASLVFGGCQAEGTLGRTLLDGRQHVTILGSEKDVRLGIHSINGFSAHADQGDLLRWCSSMKTPDRVFLVHGEQRSMNAFRAKLATSGWKDVHIPVLHETLEIPEKKAITNKNKGEVLAP
uniref:MBL fold metallo-hydrolase n=1 Tax=Leptospirillum ferriphilum TaxID=178606 RepID=A0A7C3LYG0_9BACT